MTMDRRTWLKTGLAAGVGAAAPGALRAAAPASARAAALPSPGEPFSLDYAPHFNMFKRVAGDDLVAQLEWAHDQGFRSWEDNRMATRPVEEQERIAKAMERLDMRMGVFVANFGTAFAEQSFSSGKQETRDSFLADLRKAVEVAKRVNAKWMTIVLGTEDPKLASGFQDAHAIDMLRRGAELFVPHGLVMVMEPLNFRDHPRLFVRRSDHAYALCKAVDSPAVKILFDIYHQAITEGNLIPNIDACWDEIAYFQIGDNPGRKEPGTGGVHYGNVFRHVRKRGFDGILGMEHGNSQGGAAGDRAVVAAYRQADAVVAD